MNYTSSQSYHTLNHWQSNKKSTKHYTIVYPTIFALTLDGNHIIPFVSKSLGDFTWGDDLGLVGRGVKLVPTEPTEINYCEKITFDNINYYVVLADKHSVGGLESDQTGGWRLNLKVSDGKNGDFEGDNTSVPNCTFSSQVMRGTFDEYALFVIVGDQLPSWFGGVNYEETAPDSDVSNYFNKPFQNYSITVNDKHLLQFTPIADNVDGDTIFQADVSKYFIDPVGVRADTYISIYNYVNSNLVGDFREGVAHQPSTDIHYYNNNYYTMLGEAACDAMRINTILYTRMSWKLAPISDNIYSTWVYKLTNVTYS